MTAEQAMERASVILAHAWMVRNFLKHADEIQEDEEMLGVHRTIFDSIRAVEPSQQRGDAQEYCRRLRGKLPKLRRVAEYFAQHYREISDHTNWQMASLSLSGVVQQLTDLLEQVPRGSNPAPEAEADQEGQ